MILHDRIVCGIKDEVIQRKLLSESKLMFMTALEITISMQAAARDDLKISSVSEVEKLQVKAQKLWKTEIANSLSSSNALHAGK